jgi:peroxiredoxin
LKAGTSAPSFRLPRLDGGELSLEELRGKRVLLVFSDPPGSCNALPELEKFHRATRVANRDHQVGRVTGAPQTEEVGRTARGTDALPS